MQDQVNHTGAAHITYSCPFAATRSVLLVSTAVVQKLPLPVGLIPKGFCVPAYQRHNHTQWISACLYALSCKTHSHTTPLHMEHVSASNAPTPIQGCRRETGQCCLSINAHTGHTHHHTPPLLPVPTALRHTAVLLEILPAPKTPRSGSATQIQSRHLHSLLCRPLMLLHDLIAKEQHAHAVGPRHDCQP